MGKHLLKLIEIGGVLALRSVSKIFGTITCIEFHHLGRHNGLKTVFFNDQAVFV